MTSYHWNVGTNTSI